MKKINWKDVKIEHMRQLLNTQPTLVFSLHLFPEETFPDKLHGFLQAKNGLIMAALCNRGAIIFLPCNFYLLSIFYLFPLPNLSGRRLDVYHTLTYVVALVRI